MLDAVGSSVVTRGLTRSRTILRGIETDTEDIVPDPMSKSWYAQWAAGHKNVEREFAVMYVQRRRRRRDRPETIPSRSRNSSLVGGITQRGSAFSIPGRGPLEYFQSVR